MKDEDYLDKKFPKGETKFRGEAMVLLALARIVGKEQYKEEVLGLFDERIKEIEQDVNLGGSLAIALIEEFEELKKRIEGVQE